MLSPSEPGWILRWVRFSSKACDPHEPRCLPMGPILVQGLRSAGASLPIFHFPGIFGRPPPPQSKVRFLQYLETRSTKLLDATPRWDHIVNAKTYNSSLSKKFLAIPRGSLADDISNLGRLLESAQGLREELKPLSSEDGAAAVESIAVASCSAAEGALDCAKTCMTMTACFNVVEEFAGSPKGRGMAESLLKKAHGIPEPLRKRLATIAMA